jgi:hypothetical protein
VGQRQDPPTVTTTVARASRSARPVRPDRRPLRGRSLAAGTLLAVSLLAGCGAGHHVSVGGGEPVTATTGSTTAGSTTTQPTTTSAPTTTEPTTTEPTTTEPTTAAVPTTTTPVSTTSVATSTSTSSPGSSSPSCSAAQLSVGQVPLSEGTGQYYLGWSLTNTAPTACVVAAGHPSLALVDAAGHSVVTYPTKDLPGGSASALVVAPHAVVWFLTEELSTSCPAPATVGGGPFDYVVTLPGSVPLTWSPSYLSGATLTGLCTEVPLSIGGLQDTKPRP